jgi:hypothetical protein
MLWYVAPGRGLVQGHGIGLELVRAVLHRHWRCSRFLRIKQIQYQRVHDSGGGRFLGDLGEIRRTEHARLQHDYERTLRVVAEIDAAATDQPDEDSA